MRLGVVYKWDWTFNCLRQHTEYHSQELRLTIVVNIYVVVLHSFGWNSLAYLGQSCENPRSQVSILSSATTLPIWGTAIRKSWAKVLEEGRAFLGRLAPKHKTACWTTPTNLKRWRHNQAKPSQRDCIGQGRLSMYSWMFYLIWSQRWLS